MDWKGTKRTHSQTEKEHSWRARGRKQGETDMLGGVVAPGDVLTDSEWHVVFSSAAV